MKFGVMGCYRCLISLLDVVTQCCYNRLTVDDSTYIGFY